MNCKLARTDIALWIGNDLDEASERTLERHVAACPHCREYARTLRNGLAALREPADEADASFRSLWPRMKVRLAALEDSRHLERFNGWLPALTVAAACVVTILMLDAPQPDVQRVPQSIPTISGPVSFQPQLEYTDWSPYRLRSRSPAQPSREPVWLPGGFEAVELQPILMDRAH